MQNNFVTVKALRETLLKATTLLLDVTEAMQTKGILFETASETPAPAKKTGKKRGRKPGSKNKAATAPPATPPVA